MRCGVGGDPLERFDLCDWSGACPPADRERALAALERGKIVFLPHLGFALTAEERRFLDPRVSDGKAKNISFDPRTGAIGGASLAGGERDALAGLLRRFGGAAEGLLSGLFPDYAGQLARGRASLRPVSIDHRRTSCRKDDTRLHVDVFPSQPVQGRRILRVFANVNAAGAARVWRVGGPFADYAGRFLPRQPLYPMPSAAAALACLGVTKGRRTAYDWLMLSLHDRAKADAAYQQAGAVAELRFPPGSSWIVYTDLVPHAAIAGQHALEQTFYLPIAAMRHPEASPLRILEGLTRRRLAG
jgi:3-deoxy-D-manno-oct-2-ulosonic acid (Kdo) hydroxylase